MTSHSSVARSPEGRSQMVVTLVTSTPLTGVSPKTRVCTPNLMMDRELSSGCPEPEAQGLPSDYT